MGLLRRAMEIPGLGLDLALLLVDYYIARNETARKSQNGRGNLECLDSAW